MKLESLFEKRNRSLTRINEGVDYLSRVVRENLSIFDIDNNTGNLTLMSESGAFVKCSVASDDNFVFENFEVGHVDDIFSDEKVDSYVDSEVSTFVRSLSENRYDDAENKFGNILSAFQYRNQINETRYKLEKNKERFGVAQDILSTDEYKKLMEVKDALKKLVIENVEVFSEEDTIVNSVKLSNAVTKAYNLPKREWSELVSEGHLEVPLNNNSSLYEMVCGQELIRKELLTAKERFKGSWINNESISTLASCIYGDAETIKESIKTVVTEIPYFALASKSDILDVISAVYETVNPGSVTKKDIKEFVSRIFEYKKTSRELVTETLSDHYGISLQNLKFVPSFTNLAKANSEFFGSVASKLDECIAKDVLKEFKKFLSGKSGVQILDVNDFICEVFGPAVVSESFMKPINIGELGERISELFISEEGQYKGDDEVIGDDTEEDSEPKKPKKNVKPKSKNGNGKPSDEEPPVKPGEEAPPVKPGEEAPPVKPGEEAPPEEKETAKIKKPAKKKKVAKKAKKVEKVEPVEEAAMAPAEAPPQEGAEAAEGGEAEEPQPATTQPTPTLGSDEIKGLVGDLEKLFADIDFEKAEESDEEEGIAEEEEGERIQAQDKVRELTAELEQAAAEAEELEMRAEEGGLEGDVDDVTKEA